MKIATAACAGLLILAACGDDTDKVRKDGGVYKIVDIDVNENAKGADTIKVQLTNMETGKQYTLSADGDRGEKILERLLEVLPCVEHPEDRGLITAVPCG
jgi:Elongation factor P (EF-P) KOW-like domain